MHKISANSLHVVEINTTESVIKKTGAILTTVVYDNAYMLFSRRSCAILIRQTEPQALKKVQSNNLTVNNLQTYILSN